MKKTILIVALFSIVAAVSAAEDMMDPRMMILEKVSPYGLEETIEKITENVKAAGWVVGYRGLVHRG